MAQTPLDVLRLELDLFENGRVGFEADEGAIGFIAGFALFLVL